MDSGDSRALAERVTTGIERLDFILKGGLFRGGTYLVIGPPGSGKTVLCNQLCFHVAAQGGRALYVTLLAESTSRMLRQLQSLSFFDEARIGRELVYVSGYAALEEGGLEGLLEVLGKGMRERRATVLVVDGIETARSYAADGRAYLRFLRELQALATLVGCTSLITAPLRSFEELDATTGVADGILELQHQLLGPRAIRELTVRKLRGSDYLLGRHEVEIGGDGLVVHPRTEVRFGAPPEEASEARIRMAFGVEPLDEMLHGGLLSSSTTTLIGAPGTGKTLLGLHFLVTGARAGQPGMYFGFHETPPRLCAKAEAVGLPLRAMVDDGSLEILWQPPLEVHVDALSERLLERIVERIGTGRTERLRLFVDGVSGFRSAIAYPGRMSLFFAALLHELRSLDVTTVLADELALMGPDVDMPDATLAGSVENMVLLRCVEHRSAMRRLISIIKARESAYDASVREFWIDASGVHVAPDSASAEDILAGAYGRARAPVRRRAITGRDAPIRDEGGER